MHIFFSIIVIQTSIYTLISKTRYGPNIPAADMEGNGYFDFWRFLEIFLENCWRIFDEFWRNMFVVRKLRTSNLHSVSASWKFLTMNKKVWFWPPNSLWGWIWPPIWNLSFKLYMMPCLFWLLKPLFVRFWLRKKEQSASTRPVGFAAGKNTACMWCTDLSQFQR